MDRTSAQPQVNLSLLRSNSLYVETSALAKDLEQKRHPLPHTADKGREPCLGRVGDGEPTMSSSPTPPLSAPIHLVPNPFSLRTTP
jgi:hypothetical protein